MHIGKSYPLTDFLYWTRREIYLLIVLGTMPVVLYQVLGVKWMVVPWTVVSLLGTATAFIVGFKNTQTYNRTWGALGVWGSIVNTSKYWGIICRDSFKDPELVRTLIYRHFAWLTAIRFELRKHRVWEKVDAHHNAEYQRFYKIPERKSECENEMLKYISKEELASVSKAHSMATQLLALQSRDIKAVHDSQGIVPTQFVEMQRTINAFFAQQSQVEGLKDTPYPRQYSIINTIFVRMFCILLPFGMLQEFDKLNGVVNGVMKGHMIWLLIPFTVIISWMYTSLVQVGDSTENPFEGSPNDVPISSICRSIEIDLREMLGETELPAPVKAQNEILV
ncbi:bestrophin family protein [Chitinophaga sp. GCM10012297]|uniref:Multidrug transporter n=1 Tax=Chitinophaga chungangae TaxID=2821488 RepID=A0ABS3Y9G8_9BACT|nr:bestrophin family ion channel [Chitinophaga chungangae]MBO9151326.1 hypothetical protein [Chitinophaga chungangae]